MPSGPPSPLRAKTVKKSATGAEVIQVLRPSSRQPPSTGRAVVAIDCRSEPASGSVMQMAPILSPRNAGLKRRSTMSALPSRCRNLVPISDCIAAAPASDIEPRAISASASENSISPAPLPPASSG